MGRIKEYIDDFAKLFVPNEGLNNPQRIAVVAVTLVLFLILAFIDIIMK